MALDSIRRQIQRFVTTAASFGLSVQALGGGPRWTEESHRYLGPKVVELVGSYNARVAYKERLKGVHLDLEPYTLPGWLDDDVVEENLVEYLTTIEGIVGTYRSSWTGGPTAGSSWASPSRSGSTAAATPRARSSSATRPSRPPSTSST